MLTFAKSIPQENFIKCCLSMTTLGPAQVPASQRRSQILYGHCCRMIHLTTLLVSQIM